jgi:hypothetical protein
MIDSMRLHFHACFCTESKRAAQLQGGCTIRCADSKTSKQSCSITLPVSAEINESHRFPGSTNTIFNARNLHVASVQSSKLESNAPKIQKPGSKTGDLTPKYRSIAKDVHAQASSMEIVSNLGGPMSKYAPSSNIEETAMKKFSVFSKGQISKTLLRSGFTVPELRAICENLGNGANTDAEKETNLATLGKEALVQLALLRLASERPSALAPAAINQSQCSSRRKKGPAATSDLPVRGSTSLMKASLQSNSAQQHGNISTLVTLNVQST